MRRQATCPDGDGGVSGNSRNHIYNGGREERDVGDMYGHPGRRCDRRSPHHPGAEPREGQLPHAQGHESRVGHVGNIRGHPRRSVSGGADAGYLDQDIHACPRNEETSEPTLTTDKARPIVYNPRRLPMDSRHENSGQRTTQSRGPGVRHVPRKGFDGQFSEEGNPSACSWSQEDTSDHADAAHTVAATRQEDHGGRLYQTDDTFPSSLPTVGANRASMMHNPVDAEEFARVKAKKDAYRRDLEAQVRTEQRRRASERYGKKALRLSSFLRVPHIRNVIGWDSVVAREQDSEDLIGARRRTVLRHVFIRQAQL